MLFKLILLVASLLVLTITFSATGLVISAAEPEPAPIITFSKVGSSDLTSDVVEFTLTATNKAPNPTGDNAQTVSGKIILDDPFPSGTAWFLVSSEGFSCDPFVPPTYLLHCEATGLRGRHLNDARTDFTYDAARVTVRGIRLSCGSVSNTALLTGNDILGALRASAIAYSIPCVTPIPPTPTTTPVTPTPTATVAPPTPTATVAPPTPVVIIVEVTQVPKPSVAPAAPKTGDTQPSSSADNTPGYILAALVSGMIFIAGLIWGRKRYNNRR